MTTPFAFPRIHSFPPFYTKQPNATILHGQVESWCLIILDYCRHYQVTLISREGTPLYLQIPGLDLTALPPILENKEIDRLCSTEFRLLITSQLINQMGRGEYIESKRPARGLYVHYTPLEQLADSLHQYVRETGQLGTILTIYELTKDETAGVPDALRNMDPALLAIVLKRILAKQGRAQLLLDDDNEIGGVKMI